MSKLAKLIFVATSLAPVLAAFAIRDLSDGKSLTEAGPWLLVALLLPLLCWLLLLFARKQLERHELRIVKIASTDKEVLAYLIAYLLPLLAKDTLDSWHALHHASLFFAPAHYCRVAGVRLPGQFNP